MSSLEITIAIAGILFVLLLLKMSRGGVPLDKPGAYGDGDGDGGSDGGSASSDGGGGDGGGD